MDRTQKTYNEENFSKVIFTNDDFWMTNFIDCNLQDADFTDAILFGNVVFTRCYGTPKGLIFLPHVPYSGITPWAQIIEGSWKLRAGCQTLTVEEAYLHYRVHRNPEKAQYYRRVVIPALEAAIKCTT